MFTNYLWLHDQCHDTHPVSYNFLVYKTGVTQMSDHSFCYTFILFILNTIYDTTLVRSISFIYFPTSSCMLMSILNRSYHFVIFIDKTTLSTLEFLLTFRSVPLYLMIIEIKYQLTHVSGTSPFL